MNCNTYYDAIWFHETDNLPFKGNIKPSFFIEIVLFEVKVGYAVHKFLCDFTVLDPVWVFVVAVGTSIADNTSYFSVN